MSQDIRVGEVTGSLNKYLGIASQPKGEGGAVTTAKTGPGPEQMRAGHSGGSGTGGIKLIVLRERRRFKSGLNRSFLFYLELGLARVATLVMLCAWSIY